MGKKLLICLSLLIGAQLTFAQGSPIFEVSVSSDSVLLGNYLEVKFTLRNGEGTNFLAPEFSGFKILNGPNMSQQYSMVGAEVARVVSYAFYVEPQDIGNYYIEPASIEVAGDVYETSPNPILVVPNPDGINQNEGPSFMDFFKMPGLEPFNFPDMESFDFPGLEQFNFEELEKLGIPGLDNLFDQDNMEELFKQFDFKLDSIPFPEAPQQQPSGKKKRKTTKI